MVDGGDSERKEGLEGEAGRRKGRWKRRDEKR